MSHKRRFPPYIFSHIFKHNLFYSLSDFFMTFGGISARYKRHFSVQKDYAANLPHVRCMGKYVLRHFESTLRRYFNILGIHPASFHPAYCATKFGIVGYTRSWAVSDLKIENTK